MRQTDFSLIPARPRDLPLICGWLAQADIRRWWGSVVGNQQEMRGDLGIGTPGIHPFLISQKNRAVMGFVGIADSKLFVDDYKRELTPGGFNIDILIASRNMRGAGIGTWAIIEARKQALRLAGLECAPPAFYASVLEKNRASRRAFEKAGYRLYDGPDAQGMRPETILWLKGVPYGNE